MTESFPDIEIYINRVDFPSITDWLEQNFQIVEHSSRDHTHSLVLSSKDARLECLIVERAAKGNFTSVWFKSAHTPWRTDLDCARNAAGYLGCEVRCSSGSWQEDGDEMAGWLRITPDSESRINWL